jgi:hypothetical protein
MTISTRNIAKLSLALPLIFSSLSFPAHAATYEDAPYAGRDAHSDTGAFAGARIRLRLGGGERTALRAGLTVTSMVSRQSNDGAKIYRFADGAEFGFADRDKAPRLSLAGYRFAPRRLGAAEEADGGDHHGPSTLLLVGGAVLLAAGVGVLVINDKLHDASD